jgi:hypothetical protein
MLQPEPAIANRGLTCSLSARAVAMPSGPGCARSARVQEAHSLSGVCRGRCFNACAWAALNKSGEGFADREHAHARPGTTRPFAASLAAR